jgi:CDP-glycerol glycerophosphotransferase (TagB/SpsB family)
MNKIVSLIIRIIVVVVTTFIPRSNKIWVIGSWFGMRYADNSRYLFEYLNDNKEEYGLDKIIWVTDDPIVLDFIRTTGRLAYKKKSLIGCYYHLRAKVFFYDQSTEDLNYNFTQGALVINLWHGIPLKKIGYHYKEKIKHSDVVIFLRRLLSIKKREYILETSDFSGKLLSEAFDCKTIRGVYPRNDYLIGIINSKLTEQESKYWKILKSNNKKIIFYLPTFRDKCDLKFLGTEDINIQLDILDNINRLGYILLTKVHFAEKSATKNLKHSSLINLPGSMDVYPFLKETEILITDYSSIYFDFLYLDREIIFLAYDLEYYKNSDRGLLLDFDDFTPGLKVFNSNQLVEALIRVSQNKVDFSNERKSLKSKVFGQETMNVFIENIIKLESMNSKK